MSYFVKEIFYTLQGEGMRTGRPAVFCRFSGCNLWTGREQHRSIAVCQFCDTDFVGTDGLNGGKYATAAELAAKVHSLWPNSAKGTSKPYVVCTGGEPLLQLDAEAVEALHDEGFEVAIETNGTQPLVPGIDWVCVSPKGGSELLLSSGDELKLVYPQKGAMPEDFEALDFTYHLLQPMDGPSVTDNLRAAVQYCLDHPNWRLSLQTHKLIGIP